jgi:hypothetical protein
LTTARRRRPPIAAEDHADDRGHDDEHRLEPGQRHLRFRSERVCEQQEDADDGSAEQAAVGALPPVFVLEP